MRKVSGNHDGYFLCMLEYFELFILFSEIIFLISFKRLYRPESLHILLSTTDLGKLILAFPVLLSDSLGGF